MEFISPAKATFSSTWAQISQSSLHGLYPFCERRAVFTAMLTYKGTYSSTRRCKFKKRRQLFLGVHNETLCVAAMWASDPDRSPVRINR